MRRLSRPLALAIAMLAVAAPGASAATADPAGPGCDRLDDAACLLPFPNDAFTRADGDTDTGRRIDLQAGQMPRNSAGVPIDPAPLNALDGFSPGSVILTKVPGLDTPAALERTNPVGLSDLSRYRARRAPVLVLDARTGERQLIWVELDSDAEADADRLLEIHPAKNLREGRRYIVVLRHLRRADGSRIAASPAFAALRDGRQRSRRYDRIFRTLRHADVERDRSLFLAWDFTVASERSLSGRMLHIRDDAFAQLGDRDLSDRKVRGRAAGLPDHQRHRLHAGAGRQHRAAHRGRGHGPLLPRPAGLPAGIALSLRAARRLPADPGARQRHAGAVPLQRPARGDARPPGASLALRPRPPGQLHGGQRRQRAPHGQRARRRVLRDVLGRDVQPGHRQRDLRAAGHRAHADDRRPPPAGDAELPVPGAAHAPPAGAGRPPGLPGGRALAAGHAPPVLRRQQPGRHHGRRADRVRPGLHARGPRRARHELQRAAAALGGLRHVRARVRPRLRRPARAPARAGPRPAPVGPRRGERRRRAHDRRPAARHAPPPGAAAPRLRRPPGHELPGRRRGADDRRPHPSARAGRRPGARAPAVCTRSSRSRATRGAARRSSTGTRGPSASAPTRWPTSPTARAPTRTRTRARRSPARVQKSEFLKPDGAVVDVCGGAPCVATRAP